MATPQLRTKRRRLFFDIETSPNIGLFWEAGYKKNIDYSNIIQERAIICICYKWEDEKEVYSLQWDSKQNDKTMLLKFIEVANLSTELNLRTKTSSKSTSALVCSQWPTLVPAPTDLSSSCASQRLNGLMASTLYSVRSDKKASTYFQQWRLRAPRAERLQFQQLLPTADSCE